MVETSQSDATPTLDAAKRQFLRAGDKAPNYRSTLDRAIEHFRDAEKVPNTIEHVDDVEKRHLAAYASELADRYDERRKDPEDEDGLAKSTVWTYYDCVSAFFAYCVRWEWMSENPAQKGMALNEMPDRPSTNANDQQIWQPEDRKQLKRYADRRVDEALEERGLDAVWELRDRALVYVLSYTGVRGGELLSDPRDPERTGVTWGDVDIDEQTIEVRNKKGEREEAQLPPKTHGPLERLGRALDPSSDDWPVFPTGHSPTLSKGLPDDAEPDGDYLDSYREHGLAPASLSTNGARNLLQRFCEDAGIDVDENYLKPHGARRGLGETLYREKGHAAAQRTLRHDDPETTSKHYSHIDAGDAADDVQDVIGDE